MENVPSINDVVYFVEITSTGNLSRAADRLKVRQSTLSIALQRLEYALGAKLLIRSRTGVKCTRAGLRLAAEAKVLIEDWKRIQTQVRREETELQGRFSVGCHEAVGLFTVKHFVPPLLQDNPGIELTIPHSYSRLVTEDVISCRLDFGIVTNPIKHPDLILRPLYKDKVRLWSTEALKKSKVGTLVYDPSAVEANPVLDQLEKNKLHFDRVIPVGSMETVVALAEEGVGVGVLPGQVALRYKENRLVPYGPTTLGVDVEIFLAYRSETLKSRAGQYIAKFIEKTLHQLNPRA